MLFIFTFVSFSTKLRKSFYFSFRETQRLFKENEQITSFALRLNQSFTKSNALVILEIVNSFMDVVRLKVSNGVVGERWFIVTCIPSSLNSSLIFSVFKIYYSRKSVYSLIYFFFWKNKWDYMADPTAILYTIKPKPLYIQ